MADCRPKFSSLWYIFELLFMSLHFYELCMSAYIYMQIKVFILLRHCIELPFNLHEIRIILIWLFIVIYTTTLWYSFVFQLCSKNNKWKIPEINNLLKVCSILNSTPPCALLFYPACSLGYPLSLTARLCAVWLLLCSNPG